MTKSISRKLKQRVSGNLLSSRLAGTCRLASAKFPFGDDKRFPVNKLLPLLFLSLLSACATSKKTPTPKEVVVELEDIDVKAKPKAAEIYQEVAERKWDILHTDLKIRFNIPQRELIGTADITLKPFAYPQDSLVLDAQSMDIQKVSVFGENNSTLLFRSDSAHLYIRFPKTQLPSDTTTLRIEYIAKPYAQTSGSFAAIRDDRGLYFVNAEGKIPGKPLQIWTQGETEANSHWFPTIDKPNERSTFRFQITVPDSLTVLSNGIKTLEALNSANREKTVVWEMKQPMPPYLAMMAVGKFSYIKDSTVNGVEVDYYVEPQYAPYAKDIFPNTPKMISFFSDYTGVKYPWNKYSQVAVRDYVSGAMENTSASLFGEFVNGNARERKDRSWEGVVAHELFHQWFGDYATAKSWSNITVNESFATFGEFLWDEHQYGADAAAVLRQNYLNTYLNAAKSKDPALVRHFYANEGEVFDRISYQKGGLILWNIRNITGEEKFREAMKYYLTHNANSPADAQDWRKALEAVTGQDWNPFFNQWYLRGGHPIVRFTFAKDSAGRGTWLKVRQFQAMAYKLPIEVAVMDESGMKQRLPWVLNAKRDSLLIPHSGPMPVIIPDAAHVIVGDVETSKPEAETIREFLVAEDYLSKTAAWQEIGSLTFTRPLYDATVQTLKGNRPLLKASLLQWMPEREGEWRSAEMRDLLRQLAANPKEEIPVRTAALAVFSKWDTGRATIPFYQSLLQDSSYYMAGSALEGLQKADSGAALRAAREILDRNDARSTLLTNAANVVAHTGKPEDLMRIRKNGEGKWGSSRTPIVDPVVAYWVETSAGSREALDLLRNWYFEEEAGFVKSQHLSKWQKLVTTVQEAGDNPAGKTKRLALLSFLQDVQANEKDAALAERIGKMADRLK